MNDHESLTNSERGEGPDVVDSALSVDHRARILEQIRRWARHEGVGDVGTTSSFANMEALLRREYFGRFVIELIQNARDAWCTNGRSREDRCLVQVLLHADPPVLTVCNQGVALDAEGLIKHIAQFGESSKKAGAGIGHKGIGFKSVLEISRCPEILSRTEGHGPFELRVKFDPRLTEQLIDELSPRRWSELVLECDSKELRDKDQRLPVLRFPHWLETPSSEVVEEEAVGSEGFNTLVRLPYVDAFSDRTGLDRDGWLARAREAMGGVSDEIVMLLDAFRGVRLDDRLNGTCTQIEMNSRELRGLPGGGAVRLVELTRNQTPSSSWLLYERSLGSLGETALAGEIVVGVQVAPSGSGWRLVLPAQQSRCFHLFFPTRIETRLPFLLHAYFEVDAGRTRFAPDAADRNRRLLDALADLVVESVRDLVVAEDLDHGGLAALFGAADGEPEDPLAQAFRSALLERLDSVAWVPVMGEPGLAAPRELLALAGGEASERLPIAFPSSYLLARTGLYHPHPDVVADVRARSFLASRSPHDLLGDSGVLPALVRPGIGSAIWESEASVADTGFRALMEVLGVVSANHAEVFAELAGSLRGDSSSAILPAVSSASAASEAQRRFLHPPSSERGVGTAVFARISEAGTRKGEASAADPDRSAPTGVEIGVPECVQMAFLPVDTLSPELLAGPAAALGVRPFGTDAVLDQLKIAEWSQEDSPAVAQFVWRLLLRESVSGYGIKAALGARQGFDPGKWFWCDPTVVHDRDRRRELLRRHALAHVPLPARDGLWRPAGELCFGPEWADSTQGDAGDRLVSSARDARHEAYLDLKALAPSPGCLVADPLTLAAALPLAIEDLHWLRDDVLGALRISEEARAAGDLGPVQRASLHRELLHLFLLVLGVWEIPPVEAVLNDLRAEASRVDPWEERDLPGRARWLEQLHEGRPAWFGVSYPHANVRVASDYRLVWPPSPDPRRGGEEALARALTRGAPLYGRLLRARVFCERCSHHRYRAWSRPDGPPSSFLNWQLTRSAWVPVMVDARPTQPRPPDGTWWMKDPPDDPARIAANPRRFLPLVRPGIGDALLRLVGGHMLEEAGPGELRALLTRLREDFETSLLPVDVSSGAGRQAFVSLHRLLYGRLARTAEPHRAQRIIDETGVVAHEGANLVFRPRLGVVYNDGSFSTFKRHFVGRVPFAPLNVGDDDIAKALGLPIFVVECKMLPFETSESHTELVGDFLEDRLPEVMALLTHLAIGGRPLDIDSEQFRIRSQRIRDLEVVRISDVVLELSVALAGRDPISTTIGQGPNHDVFLDLQPRKPPVLYHDFQGPNWFDPLRRRLGEVVARLVENSAFRDTLALYFQADEDARETFLAERGVTAGALEQVRKALGRAGQLSRRLARSWWTGLLRTLSLPVDGLEPEVADLDSRACNCLAKAGWGSEELRSALLRAGGVEQIRSDTSPGGILDQLEQHGVELAHLDEQLRAAGDPGLRVDTARDLLRRWRAEHGPKVTFVLERLGMPLDEARSRTRGWEVPSHLRFRVRVSLAEVLADVVEDLAASGVVVEAAALGSADLDSSLAGSVGIPLDDWDQAWRQVFSPEDRANLLRQRANAWREAAEVPVVALITVPGDLPHRLRAGRDAYQEEVRPVANLAELRHAVHALLSARGVLPSGEALLSLMESADEFGLPPREALLDAVPDALKPHVAEVVAAIRRRSRQRLDAIRKNMEELEATGIKPMPFVGPRRVPRRRGGPDGAGSGKKKVRVGKVGKRDLDRIGARGEMWALAAVVAPLERLLAEEPDRFEEVLHGLRSLLTEHWEGPAVEELLPHGDRAADRSVPFEDRLEALADFLHLSEVSDSFGCDILGWLPPYADAEPQPLALEVKSSTGRSFLASDHEWGSAARLSEEYAFLVILRKGKSVHGMDLLPHPEALRDRELLVREPDTWKVTYSGAEPPKAPIVEEAE